jgi:hypothetical protein
MQELPMARSGATAVASGTPEFLNPPKIYRRQLGVSKSHEVYAWVSANRRAIGSLMPPERRLFLLNLFLLTKTKDANFHEIDYTSTSGFRRPDSCK